MNTPKKAFVLGAGLGTRLRPLTDHQPKPMVSVGGRPMIDHILQALSHAGVEECVVNTHYHADVLEGYLRDNPHRSIWPALHISYEPVLLDTGGGIKNALRYFDAPFFVLSGDSLWENAPQEDTLRMLAAQWNPEIMDILMVLQPLESMIVTGGAGDYDLGPEGQAVRSLSKQGQAMFTSIRINHPRIFENTSDGAFSYLSLMDRAEAAGRIYGVLHKGAWHHISTPQDVAAVNGLSKTQARKLFCV